MSNRHSERTENRERLGEIIDVLRRGGVEVVAAQGQASTPAVGLVADNARLAQHLHEVRLGRLRQVRVGGVAGSHVERTVGELAGDGEALGVAEREEHVGQLDLGALGVRKIARHGSRIVEQSSDGEYGRMVRENSND